MSSIEVPAWGLKRNITPQLGARLVQQGNRLHYGRPCWHQRRLQRSADPFTG